MTLRICPDANTCPSDQPLDNFSSEADDTLDYFSTFFAGAPPPLLHNFTATQCGVTFESTISQLDADLQARSAAIQCNNNNNTPVTSLFTNAPQTCCVPCPDGTNTCYTVPGGLFTAATQQEANSLANAVACDLVSRNMICIGNLPGCTCVNNNYDATVTSNVEAIWSLNGGSLPPGLSIQFTSTSAEVFGTPNTPGMFTFQILAQSLVGPYMIKTFTITVLQITVGMLPNFTIGTPYFFQMSAEGGSGNYNWKIVSGSLPPGINMSLTGLISGTPTGSGTNPITFDVIDLNCESADQTFFPPKVTLSTKSTTQIATALGWSEMPGFVSSPPKKYQTVTWTGSSEQQLWYVRGGVQATIQNYTGTDPNTDMIVPASQTATNQYCVKSGSQLYQWNPAMMKWLVASDQTAVTLVGGARYDFGGTDQIDDFGNVISNHTKFLSVMCNSSSALNTIIGPPIPNSNANVAAPFTGYFGTNFTQYSNLFGPTELCPSPSIPYTSVGNIAAMSPFQNPAVDLIGLWGSSSEGGGNSFLGTATVSITNSTLGQSMDTGLSQNHNVFTMNPYALTSPPGAITVFASIDTPIGIIPLPFDWSSYCAVVFTNNFSATLSSEYTDDLALTNAQVIVGNGATAQNAMRTTGFQSSFTNVVYTLACTNLASGKAYIVSVDLADLTAGTTTTSQIGFVADSTGMHNIVGAIPTPASGHLVQVRNPQIIFSP